MQKGNKMYKYGEKSAFRLSSCHPDIQKIFNEVIKFYDVSILEGHRTAEKQKEYYDKGLSKLDGVTQKSKHQSIPSMAIDVMPYKKGTNPFTDKGGSESFFYLAGIIKMVALYLYNKGEITHKIRWGGDFNGDEIFNEKYNGKFLDLPHFELV